MFAGIVEEKAKVVDCGGGSSTRLEVESGLDHSETQLGDSVAIDGVCLTVVQKENNRLLFDVSQETIRRSTLSDLKTGDTVNLERSLQIGKRIHGHFVFGHVDQVSTLLARSKEGSGYKLCWSFSKELRHFFAPKCSVAIAGVSLTVGEVEQDRFAVYLVPHTLQMTTLLDLTVGQKANLEVDMLARYVQSMLLYGRQQQPGQSVVTLDFLREHGFEVD